MTIFLTILHVMLCFVLVLVVLLQPSKSSEVGAAFGGGGGSSTIFGPRGPGNLLSKATTVVAVLFMITSITLAIRSNKSAAGGSGIDDQLLQQPQEQEQPTDWGSVLGQPSTTSQPATGTQAPGDQQAGPTQAPPEAPAEAPDAP